MKIHFKENVNFAGIPAYRFETGNDFLNEIGPEYGNECYCIDKIEKIPHKSNGCLYKGAIDLSSCQGKFGCKNFFFFPIFKRDMQMKLVHLNKSSYQLSVNVSASKLL